MTGMIANILNQFSLDFTLPISLVDENMLRCQDQDAVYKSKLWWRTDLFEIDHDYTTNTLETTLFTRSVPQSNKPRTPKI